MNNPLTTQEANPQPDEDSPAVFKIASHLILAFVLTLGITFILKGGLVLLLFLFMGNFCC